jgi:hypothetical protein
MRFFNPSESDMSMNIASSRGIGFFNKRNPFFLTFAIKIMSTNRKTKTGVKIVPAFLTSINDVSDNKSLSLIAILNF